MHGCHDDVEFAEQGFLLIQRTILEDVDLDAGENRETLGGLRADERNLLTETLCGEPAGDAESR